MSLIFRQKAQEILDKAKMSQFYAGITEDKEVALCNDCGKQVISIGGIKFSRTNPTHAEIDYAVELLNVFLKKNAKKIRTLIDEADILASMPDPKPADYPDLPKFEFQSRNRQWDKINKTWFYADTPQITYRDRKFTINLDIEGNFQILAMDVGLGMSLEEVLQWEPNCDLHNRMVAILQQRNAYLEQFLKVNALKGELNTCTVSL